MYFRPKPWRHVIIEVHVGRVDNILAGLVGKSLER